MNNLAREKLCELIIEQSSSVIGMTGMFELLLRQKCPECTTEVAAIGAAVKTGVAAEIKRSPGGAAWGTTAETCTKMLSRQALLTPEDAEWVVETWGEALGKTPGSEVASSETPTILAREWERSTKDRPIPGSQMSGALRLRIWFLIIVTLTGGVGGALPAFFVYRTPIDTVAKEPADGDDDRPDGPIIVQGDPNFRRGGRRGGLAGRGAGPVIYMRSFNDFSDPTVMEAVRTVKQKPYMVISCGMIGMIAGMVGSAIGFVLGSGRSRMHSLHGGKSFGKLGLAMLYAFRSSYGGALVGLLMAQDTAATFFGTGFAALVATAIGAFLGEVFSWYFFPVFFMLPFGMTLLSKFMGP
jgi:hypothetical protein